MLALSPAGAQSLAISQNGISVSGTTLYVYGSPADFELAQSGFLIRWPGISSNKEVKCKRYELSFVPGTNNYICWGSHCESPFAHTGGQHYVYTMAETVILAPGADSITTFSAHYLPKGMPGSSEYRYVFYDKNNPTDSSYVNILFNASTSNAVRELSADFQLELYPNPTHSLCKLRLYTSSSERMQVQVYSAEGRLISTGQTDYKTGAGFLEYLLNTENLPDGFYWIRCSNASGNWQKKLLVSH